MAEGGCPVCRCKSFHIRNPEDSFETYEIDVEKSTGEGQDDQPEWCVISEETKIYCNRCSWHGEKGELKP
jgi:hypothetical protein